MASISPLPSPLDEEHTRRLRAAGENAGGPTEPTALAPVPPPVKPERPVVSGTKVRRFAKKALVRTFEVAGGRPLVARLTELRDEQIRQREQLDAIRADWVDAELRLGHSVSARHDLDANRVNLELLKGELRQLQHTLEELGMAFAPGAGLAGAAARFSELRESVNGLERRVRNLSQPVPSNGQAAVTDESGAPATPPPDAAPTSTLFNYVGFERRFRGDPEIINERLRDRYGQMLREHQPVVDIGCGRAELLETLAADGVEVIGVEPDPGMVAEGRARGVTVHQALAGEYLRSVENGSLGSIITTHVVEHLPLDALIEMLELSVRKLRPGGVFVAETPNPASLIVLGNSYIMDPTHVLPLHPSLLTFLCESAGFRDVRLRLYEPAYDYHLAHVTAPEDAPDWARAMAEQVNGSFDKLNDVLFGPQEYAVIATTPN